MDRDIGVTVAALLVRQLDVKADGFAAVLHRAFVRRLHDARPAAGDDGKVMFGQSFGDVMRGAIILVTRFCPRGAKDRDRRAGLGQRLERIHELSHDAENAPRILTNESIAVAHGCNIIPPPK